jgi:hypothetical protein
MGEFSQDVADTAFAKIKERMEWVSSCWDAQISGQPFYLQMVLQQR